MFLVYSEDDLIDLIDLIDDSHPTFLSKTVKCDCWLTWSGTLWCIDLFLFFLNAHSTNSRIPFRKFRLKNAYKNGFIPELKYETRNVNGVRSASKFESPR